MNGDDDTWGVSNYLKLFVRIGKQKQISGFGKVADLFSSILRCRLATSKEVSMALDEPKLALCLWTPFYLACIGYIHHGTVVGRTPAYTWDKATVMPLFSRPHTSLMVQGVAPLNLTESLPISIFSVRNFPATKLGVKEFSGGFLQILRIQWDSCEFIDVAVSKPHTGAINMEMSWTCSWTHTRQVWWW